MIFYAVLESLHAVSLDLLAVWERPESRALLPPWATAKLEFICADATEYAWEDADLWFANSTCFDEELMAKLAVVANRMRVGTFGVTFTKALPSALWQVRRVFSPRLQSETSLFSACRF